MGGIISEEPQLLKNCILPIEVEQTKNFQPNNSLIEIIQVIFRILGIFCWVMLLTKIGYLFGKKDIDLDE